MRHFALALLATVLLSAPAHAETKDHVQEVDDWHAGRIERLHNPDGWLTLVGLYWLEDGANSFGSAADNTLVFPESAPAHAGVLHVADGKVRLEPHPDAKLRVGDVAATEMELVDDRSDGTTVLSMGTYRFYVIERQGSLLLRVRDHDAPLLQTFEGIDRWPVDAKWRVDAYPIPYDPPKTLIVPDILGTESRMEIDHAVGFKIDGVEYRLDPMPSGDSYFLVFGDTTNGVDTYGGGRFVYADWVNDADEIVLDFNRAYNPPCVFTDYATCPLPPKQNKLPVDIPAGEKMFGAAH